METPKPQTEHEWLQRLVGEWTCEGEATAEPGQPPVKWTTNETVRSLDGLWILAEGLGQMPDGSTSTTLVTLGYDPQKGRYVGTFIGTMMTNLWVYEGSLDSSGNVLNLDTEGPDMCGGTGAAQYRDIMEFQNANERTLTSTVQGPDGTWTQIMTAHYRRSK